MMDRYSADSHAWLVIPPGTLGRVFECNRNYNSNHVVIQWDFAYSGWYLFARSLDHVLATVSNTSGAVNLEEARASALTAHVSIVELIGHMYSDA